MCFFGRKGIRYVDVTEEAGLIAILESDFSVDPTMHTMQC